MNEVKIIIPDNCELIKKGDTYTVRKKKNNPPRSWEEFCKNYPTKEEESYIDVNSKIYSSGAVGIKERKVYSDKNLCLNRDEAEAFLALMQLRQLRKAWVGDWEQKEDEQYAVIRWHIQDKEVEVSYYVTGYNWAYPLTFPTKEMAKDFLSCFKDLCETSKILL